MFLKIQLLFLSPIHHTKVLQLISTHITFNQLGYLQPIVMVQLKDPIPRVLVNIQCTAQAKLIEHDTQNMRGSIYIEFFMDYIYVFFLRQIQIHMLICTIEGYRTNAYYCRVHSIFRFSVTLTKKFKNQLSFSGKMQIFLQKINKQDS